MRVLVTGHHGYIGSVLAPFLAAWGHDVVGLDTYFYSGCDFGSEVANVPSLVGDVRDISSSALKGFEAVVHLAALSNDPLGDLDPELTFDINLFGTLAIARAARDAGVERFIFFSSCSMYGAAGAEEGLTEDAPLRPLTPYAESKVRAEEALRELARDDFCPVSMRNATVYGVSPRLRLDIVLNNLAAWAETTRRIRLLSDGTSWRPMVHVRDVALVASMLLDAPADSIRGEAFNVGSNAQNYRIRELAEVLAEVTGCEIEVAPEASADPRSYRVDFSKLSRSFPSFQPEWDAVRGARELIDAYRDVGMTSALFESKTYIRLRQLRYLLESGALHEDLRWVVGRSPVAA